MGSEMQQPLEELLKPQQTINDRFVVQGPLGEGAFGSVCKVFDHITRKVYAFKVIKESTTAHQRLIDEFNILEGLNHPAIGKVKWLDQIRGTPVWYLILDYIEGQPLSTLIQHRQLSIKRAVAITKDLLEGLAYVHAHGLLHRDVKPNNIMVTSDGIKLIDFNIARSMDDVAMANTGTRPYMAPDVFDNGWDASGDTYSAGICLYQMLTGVYPFENGIVQSQVPVPDPKEKNPAVARSLADVVMKAIQPKRANRFITAAAMLDALNSLAEIEDRSALPILDDIDLAALGIDENSLAEPGQNPFLPLFLSLYSQSKGTNTGTRGLDPFSRYIYADTKIDRELRPAIERGEFSLVIITGNAGDGKTAFIQMLEEEVRPECSQFERDPGGNGARFVYRGRSFVTNYDGSQDEGDVANDAVLAEFFEPFQGRNWRDMDAHETRVIAINQGRLVDFFLHNRRTYQGLSQQITRFFDNNEEPDDGLMIVNLNLRAVTAGDGENASIFDKLLDRFTAPVFWAGCKSCDLADRCYVRFNVDSVRDPVYGEQVRERLRRLFTAAHYREQLHVTIRDLRSALSYILFGVRTCDEIRMMLDDPAQRLPFLGYHYYNAPFADSDANDIDDERGHRLAEPSGDRLIRLLSQGDIAQVANPHLDAELNTISPELQPRFADFAERPDYERTVLTTLFVERAAPGSPIMDVDAATQRGFHNFVRRKAYFERPDRDVVGMLPFTTFPAFDGIVRRENGDQEDVHQLVTRALSASEGIFVEPLRSDHVCLRTTVERKATIKSVRLFPSTSFAVNVPEAKDVARFIEYLPSAFSFIYQAEKGKSRDALRLQINLDLFEMLSRIDRGFTPSMEELKGPFLNMLMFKTQLQSILYRELLLTTDERSFYRVQKRSDNSLELTPVAIGEEG